MSSCPAPSPAPQGYPHLRGVEVAGPQRRHADGGLGARRASAPAVSRVATGRRTFSSQEWAWPSGPAGGRPRPGGLRAPLGVAPTPSPQASLRRVQCLGCPGAHPNSLQCAPPQPLCAETEPAPLPPPLPSRAIRAPQPASPGHPQRCQPLRSAGSWDRKRPGDPDAWDRTEAGTKAEAEGRREARGQARGPPRHRTRVPGGRHQVASRGCLARCDRRGAGSRLGRPRAVGAGSGWSRAGHRLDPMHRAPGGRRARGGRSGRGSSSLHHPVPDGRGPTSGRPPHFLPPPG